MKLKKKLSSLLNSSDDEEENKNSKKKKASDEPKSLEERSTAFNLDFNSIKKLELYFFDQDCVPLAKKLLGKYLIRKINGTCLVGKIVEVEAYLGGCLDKASHSYNNKQTSRNKAMFMTPGTCYVYNIYGIYCCMNISARGDGNGVLLRALEPIYGFDSIKSNCSLRDLKKLTNGPSKLCKSLQITKNEFDQVDLSNSSLLWLQDRLTNDSVVKEEEIQIVKSKRIGLNVNSVGTEAFEAPLRFYIKNNNFVSIKKVKDEIETDDEI